MNTFLYKGWYIHDNFTSGVVKYQNPETNEIHLAISVFSAKINITKIINGAKNG